MSIAVAQVRVLDLRLFSTFVAKTKHRQSEGGVCPRNLLFPSFAALYRAATDPFPYINARSVISPK
jgi:hypothetical protein